MIDLECPVCGGTVAYRLLPEYKNNVVEITCHHCNGRKWTSILTGIIPPKITRTKRGFKRKL